VWGNYNGGYHNASVRCTLKEKTAQDQIQGRELIDRFHTLARAIEEVHTELVAQDKTHVSVGGLLDANPFRGRGYFWEENHEGKKGYLEGKATHVREACEVHMQGRPNDFRFSFFAMYCKGL
jgi:hypothetical protein